MVLEETIMSKQIVKPSSPTPDNLKHHKLSFLDQVIPFIYVPLILFYENEESKYKPQSEISHLLKQSLSEILTTFYPFAGTIHENSYVDCNDRGVEFVEAQVHARLAQVTEEPHMEEIKQLVPADSSSHRENAILLVKLNCFYCGGIALGVCLSHKVGDFASLALFMNAWATTTCSGKAPTVEPYFNLALHFPPKDSIPTYFPPDKEIITTRRLVFDRKKLERLKQLVGGSSEVKNPTSMEALSVFLWKQFIEAHHKAAISGTLFGACIAVNLRQRAKQPLLEHTIGNFAINQIVFASDTMDCSEMLSKLSSAIREVDNNYIKTVFNSDEYLEIIQKISGKVLGLTNLCWFPLYKLDFGWGKPFWFTTSLPHKNAVILTSTASEDGIEALINLPEDFFQLFQTNYNKLLI